MNKFISKWGYIKPNSKCIQSENGIQFTVEKFYTQTHRESLRLTKLFQENVDSNGGEFRTLPGDPNPRFSLDQMSAVAGFARSTGNLSLLKALPLFRKYSLRPDNFCYLLYCKYPLLGFWFLWITSIAMIISCCRKNNGTSGKILAYIKARGAGMWTTWSICERVMPWNMRTSFAIYFPEYDHIIREDVREIWE